MLFALLCAACFFPLAIYLLVLSLVNRQHRPMLVPGTWDFAGILFAVSGFLVFGVAGILIGVNELLDPRSAFVEPVMVADAPATQVSQASDALAKPLAISWALYLIVLVSGAIFQMWRQRRQTVVYCVNPAEFEQALVHVLARLGLTWKRAGQEVILTMLGGRVVQLRVDSSPALRTVALTWDNIASEDRRMIETELANDLISVRTRHNSLSGWFLGIAVLLLLLTCALAALAVLIALLGAR